MQTYQFHQIGEVLHSDRWFVPPYVSVGILESVAIADTRAQQQFSQDNLEKVLTLIYSPSRLVSMVLHRYPQMPVWQGVHVNIIPLWNCIDIIPMAR